MPEITKSNRPSKTDPPVDEAESRSSELLARMTLHQKINQMSGDENTLRVYLDALIGKYNTRPYLAGNDPDLGIPALAFTDGPRGVVLGHSTCFPVAMGRGASWDVELEQRIGEAIGIEARAQGANFFGGICINLLRHPAWGRSQETYGEDPFHLGEMGAALTRGVQRHVMGCVKHFACNSIENARFKVNVLIDERTLQEVYLPHFRRVVDEGVAAVMSAYNRVNGAWCGHHRHLLRDILKGEWGFQGFVISDFLRGIHSAEAAVRGGLDLEMPSRQLFHRHLSALVKGGSLPESMLDESVHRIIHTKLRFESDNGPDTYRLAEVASQTHRDLARESAQKSIVLLINDPVNASPLLPLDASQQKRVAILGELAVTANIGDHGSSQVRPTHVVTPLEGLQAALPGDVSLISYTGKDLRRAAETASQADIAIVVAGYRHNDEGEYMARELDWLVGGGDRESLALPRAEEELILTVAAANPHTVVVLIGGGPILMEAWRQRVPAILMAWYPGMEGGHAIADILFGKVNPSGKLPCSFPRSPDHLPFFDSNAEVIEYGYFHGYWLLDRENHPAAFPFGYGLSYTKFEYSHLLVQPGVMSSNGTLDIQVDVTNCGQRSGAEIAQLYVGYPDAEIERPVRQLKGFQRLELAPGQTRTIHFKLTAEQLAYYDVEQRTWVVPPERYLIQVGPSSREIDLLTADVRVFKP